MKKITFILLVIGISFVFTSAIPKEKKLSKAEIECKQVEMTLLVNKINTQVATLGNTMVKISDELIQNYKQYNLYTSGPIKPLVVSPICWGCKCRHYGCTYIDYFGCGWNPPSCEGRVCPACGWDSWDAVGASCAGNPQCSGR